MAKPQEETKDQARPEPRGFGEHTRGLAGEYAHEQGWGLDVEERTAQHRQPQDIDGGTDYDYGAQDQGDTPVNTAIDHNEKTRNEPAESGRNKE